MEDGSVLMTSRDISMRGVWLVGGVVWWVWHKVSTVAGGGARL